MLFSNENQYSGRQMKARNSNQGVQSLIQNHVRPTGISYWSTEIWIILHYALSYEFHTVCQLVDYVSHSWLSSVRSTKPTMESFIDSLTPIHPYYYKMEIAMRPQPLIYHWVRYALSKTVPAFSCPIFTMSQSWALKDYFIGKHSRFLASSLHLSQWGG